MVNDKMCLRVEKDRLTVRLDPAKFDEVIEHDGCRLMDFTGKAMKGFVFVSADVLSTKRKLNYWIRLDLDYNQFAKPGKKKATAGNKSKSYSRKEVFRSVFSCSADYDSCTFI